MINGFVSVTVTVTVQYVQLYPLLVVQVLYGSVTVFARWVIWIFSHCSRQKPRSTVPATITIPLPVTTTHLCFVDLLPRHLLELFFCQSVPDAVTFLAIHAPPLQFATVAAVFSRVSSFTRRANFNRLPVDGQQTPKLRRGQRPPVPPSMRRAAARSLLPSVHGFGPLAVLGRAVAGLLRVWVFSFLVVFAHLARFERGGEERAESMF